MDPRSVRALLVRLGLTAGLGSCAVSCDSNHPIVGDPPAAHPGMAGTGGGSGAAGGAAGTTGGGGDAGGNGAAGTFGNALYPYPDAGSAGGTGGSDAGTVSPGRLPFGNPPPPLPDAGGGASDATDTDGNALDSDGAGG